MVKKFIPASLKLWYTINKRRCSDLFNGNYKRFASRFAKRDGLFPIVTIEQAIRLNELAENKAHNIGLAINKLDHISIGPGKLFSFWQLVGNPSKKNSYKKSRSIIAGEMEATIGGGLCQLSGLIYFLALRAGLTITERHPHSLDIYTEAERFTPLGSDATVAYGYKDLRFINPHKFVVCFSFQLTQTALKGTVSATERMAPCTIEFEYRKKTTYTDVTTTNKVNGETVVIDRSRYGLYSPVKPSAHNNS